MILWTTVFIDAPAADFDATAEFWARATGATLSPPRGHRGEFVSLVPTEGAPYLKIQRTDEGHAGTHLDLHVADIDAAHRRVLELGAVDVADHGYRVMASPAGYPFCLVTEVPSGGLGPALSEPVAHRVDQLCIDVPAGRFDEESAFWGALFDSPLRQGGTHPEFVDVPTPDGLSFSLLIQRLGDDDPRTRAEAHIDVSCGDQQFDVAAHHVQHLGATHVDQISSWTVLHDPAGLAYCTTSSPFRP